MTTLQDLINDINTKLVRVGSDRISGPDIQTTMLKVVDLLGQAQTQDIIPDYAAELTFQTDGSDDGRYCAHPDTNGRSRIWKTKVDDNTGNEPPTDPEITSDTNWEERSPSVKSGIQEWSAGIYGAGFVAVSWNHSTDGYNIYQLVNPTRPFESANIETEIAGGDWVEYTKAARDAAIAAAVAAATIGLWDDRGNFAANVDDAFPATGGSGESGAILKGDIWTVSVAGTINGAAVEIGDTVRALVDDPGQTASNWAIGNISNDIVTGVLNILGALRLSGTVYSELGSDANNLNPSSWASTYGVLRLNATAGNVNITGLVAGASGKLGVIMNVGDTYLLTLKDESTSSTEANRFAFGRDITIAPGRGIIVWYDSSDERWRIVANSDTEQPSIPTTGTAVKFDTMRLYGVSTPETGNITLNATGLKAGMTQTMRHNHSGTPTFGSEFKILGGSYVTDTVNVIHMQAISASIIHVTISQEP